MNSMGLKPSDHEGHYYPLAEANGNGYRQCYLSIAVSFS